MTDISPMNFDLPAPPPGGLQAVQRRARRLAFRHQLMTAMASTVFVVVAVVGGIGAAHSLQESGNPFYTKGSDVQTATGGGGGGPQPMSASGGGSINPTSKALPGRSVASEARTTSLLLPFGAILLIAGLILGRIQLRRRQVPISRVPRVALSVFLAGAGSIAVAVAGQLIGSSG